MGLGGFRRRREGVVRVVGVLKRRGRVGYLLIVRVERIFRLGVVRRRLINLLGFRRYKV
jgi:hypothetical protein